MRRLAPIVFLIACGDGRDAREVIDATDALEVTAPEVTTTDTIVVTEIEDDTLDDDIQAVTITVTLDGEPVEGARVTQGGTDTFVLTGPDGTALAPLDRSVPGKHTFMASVPDARIGASFDWRPGKTALSIALTRYAPTDNPAYLFQDPGEPTRRDTTAECAHCHKTINEAWFDSPHRRSAQNPNLHDLYGDVVAETGGFGGCADCHAPGIDGQLGGRDLRDASAGNGRAYDYGVHCDVCHRVESIDLAAPPGVGGRLKLMRPSEPSGSPGLGVWRPLTFGPSHDVANPRMGLVQRDHFRQATLCAGCHELRQGELPVHETYSEWLQTPLSPGVPCQSCHMPPDVTVWNGADLQDFGLQAASTAAGWPRPEGYVNAHSFIGPRQRGAFVVPAASLSITKAVAGDVLTAEVTVTNDGAGHKLPTGEPLRAVLLLVSARCGQTTLTPTGGDVIDALGGDEAGLPGTMFAKVLVDADGNLMAPHYRAVAVARDNRLNRGESATTQHTFATSCSNPTLDARLLHRPYPTALARARGWVERDTVIVERTE